MIKKAYSLLVQLLDAGWEIKEFNSKEVTLVPKRGNHGKSQA